MSQPVEPGEFMDIEITHGKIRHHGDHGEHGVPWFA